MKKLKKILLTAPEDGFTDESCTALSPLPEEEEQTSFFQMPKWFEKAKEKIPPFPWKGINTKNALIAGCLVIVAIAGYLNIRYALPQNNTSDPADQVQEEVGGESFFASAVIDRERARGEALEVLVGITEDETASETAKSDAFTQMERIANETSWEIDIENLVKSKGFEECVAIISENSANIVVASEGLTPGEVAQIKEIVYLESSINPKDVKIIEKN